MRARTFAIVIGMLLVVATVAEAQGRGGFGGFGGGFGGGRGGRGGGMGGGGERMQPPDPLLLRGPLPTDSLSAIVSLDDAQRQRYATLYDHFTKNTRLERDSLRTITDLMRDARQNGDRSVAQGYMSTMRELRDGLSQQQKPFDDAVKELLTKSQWKKYDQWHKDLRKQAAAERGGDKGGQWSSPR